MNIEWNNSNNTISGVCFDGEDKGFIEDILNLIDPNWKDTGIASWKQNNNGDYFCSSCGIKAEYHCSYFEIYGYREWFDGVCPNCGKNMVYE